mmetsp:Transcript_47933/g.139738  ORF Transcript_47933/g.139738 Transcript_47933/m.139738 type:complete len:274 (+) Transcript_47933:956-1777(+)
MVKSAKLVFNALTVMSGYACALNHVRFSSSVSVALGASGNLSSSSSLSSCLTSSSFTASILTPSFASSFFSPLSLTLPPPVFSAYSFMRATSSALLPDTGSDNAFNLSFKTVMVNFEKSSGACSGWLSLPLPSPSLLSCLTSCSFVSPSFFSAPSAADPLSLSTSMAVSFFSPFASSANRFAWSMAALRFSSISLICLLTFNLRSNSAITTLCSLSNLSCFSLRSWSCTLCLKLAGGSPTTTCATRLKCGKLKRRMNSARSACSKLALTSMTT